MPYNEYPKHEIPQAKHDILALPWAVGNGRKDEDEDSRAITTLSQLIESMVASSKQTQLPKDIVKLATVYTYPDAPMRPKPFSRAPRVWSILSRSLFDRVTRLDGNSGGVVTQFTFGVKLPNANNNAKDTKNSKQFSDFMTYLNTRDAVAMLARDSAGRIAFVAPMASRAGGNEDYAAHVYCAPMTEFISLAQRNHSLPWQDDGDEEPETWTPQYTPPPECDEEPDTWTPQYTPPPEEEVCPGDSPVLKLDNDDYYPAGTANGHADLQANGHADGELFVPPGANGHADGELFVPPGANGDSGGWGSNDGAWGVTSEKGTEEDVGAGLWGWKTEDGDKGDENTNNAWDNNNSAWDNNNSAWDNNDKSEDKAEDKANSNDMTDGVFHANAGAAAADAFYSGLTRSLDTRADSRLYHMRAFNGWVKATQIAELDPDTSLETSGTGRRKVKQRSRRSPLRVLDLACGKGGDLGKWSLHSRSLENYVGVDVARGSLIDAANRARQMKNKHSMKRCTFTLADLGEDVPGRKRHSSAQRMQKLLTWSLQEESHEDQQSDPKFVAKEGGGIAPSDKFDVVSIQFAIHYMMSTRKRALRFFHTVSSLLEIGGNLIATTIDARVVIEKLMALGKDLHFDDHDAHVEVDAPHNESIHNNGNKKRKVTNEEGATVAVGRGVCRLKFDAEMLRRVFHPPNTLDDMYGLQYTFTLVEGEDHAAGVGEAVDLPEWLTPIPALKELADEAGLELVYATNFHTFYNERKSPSNFPAAHNALYNMKVLNKNGSISGQEWEVSRMYIAVKFRKVRESKIDLGDEDVTEEEMSAG